MEERAACAQLKLRFEAAGFHITENQTFDEDGVRFDIDGFDAARRVGYEYVTEEAGDGWDVDGAVIAALAERRKRGELHVLIIDEADAPDAASLDHAIDEFLRTLPGTGAGSDAAEQPAPAAEHAAPAAEHAAPAAASLAADVEELVPDAEEVGRTEQAAPAAKSKAKSSRPPPTPKAAKKKPTRKPK